MKLQDLRKPTQEHVIEEMAELFTAIGQYHMLLAESQLDEAGAWNRIKSAGSKVVQGVKSANDAVDRLGRLAQNTGPVKNFDDKVEDILDRIGDKNPKIKELATKYGEWAKKNPVKQGLIIGMLTATAGVLAGPGGGAAAGAILRAGNELLKGERASTAVGKAAKTAAVGAALGAVAGASVQTIGQAFKAAEPVMEPLKQLNNVVRLQINHTINGNPILTINQLFPKEVADQIRALHREASNALNTREVDRAMAVLRRIDSMVEDPRVTARVNQMVTQNNVIQAENDAIRQAFANRVEQAAQTNAQIDQLLDRLSTGAQATAQGAAAASGSGSAATAAKPAAKPAATAAKQTMSPERRAELKARQQAWQADQRRMGKLK